MAPGEQDIKRESGVTTSPQSSIELPPLPFLTIDPILTADEGVN